MRALRGWFVRFADVFLSSRRERDLSLEIESHLQMHIADNIRRGLSPAEARRQAALSLGGIEQTKERYRDQRGLPFLDTLRQDVTYAVRVLRRDAAFTLTAVLTLALGIGANSAVFSAIDAALLRPLSFDHPDRLVAVFAASPARGNLYDETSYPAFLDWRNQNRSFEALAAISTWNVTVLASNGTAYAHARAVSANMFDVLGTHVAIGGDFRGWRPGDDDVVVLSHGFWNRLYGSRSRVPGERLRINGRAYLIAGVMPDTFWIESPDEDFYVPLTPSGDRGHEYVRAIGRLKPAATVAAARSEMQQIAARLSEEYPRFSAGVGVTVVPLADALARSVRGGLVTMLGVVGLLLIIACTNVAGLLLARGVARQRELSVRAALGAGRARLVRQLLTESVLIALAGGAAGLVLASWVAHGLGAALAEQFHVARLADTTVDARVILFTMAISLATGVCFGTFPALASLRQLHWNARTAGLRVGQSMVHRGLVVGEIALALVMLAGAGTLLKTFVRLKQTAPGFEPARLLHVDLRLPQPAFAIRNVRAAFYASALERLRAVPGVESAALVSDLPLTTGMDHESFHITGRPDPGPNRQFRATFNLVSSGYFRTMGIPVEAGREFADADGEWGAAVAVINRTAAQTFWPGTSALGRQIVLPITDDTSVTMTIVGVVGDVKQSRLSADSEPEVFVSAITYIPRNVPRRTSGGYPIGSLGYRVDTPWAILGKQPFQIVIEMPQSLRRPQ